MDTTYFGHSLSIYERENMWKDHLKARNLRLLAWKHYGGNSDVHWSGGFEISAYFRIIQLRLWTESMSSDTASNPKTRTVSRYGEYYSAVSRRLKSSVLESPDRWKNIVDMCQKSSKNGLEKLEINRLDVIFRRSACARAFPCEKWMGIRNFLILTSIYLSSTRGIWNSENFWSEHQLISRHCMDAICQPVTKPHSPHLF